MPNHPYKEDMSGERDSECERNTGWVRVSSRRQKKTRVLREGPSLKAAGNTNGYGRSYRRGNWRDRKDITSFYFTRFPEDVTEEDLWHHFKKFGDVREIFISKKKNSLGRKYGFVRFQGVESLHQLERRLDNTIFGGLKMHVNIPKFGRAHSGQIPSSVTRRESAMQGEDEMVARRQQGQRVRQRSYAEVLQRNITTVQKRRPVTEVCNNKPTSRSEVYLDIPLKGQKWLQEAWVGRLKNLAIFDRVEEELPWDIGASVAVKYIGDDMVVILGLDDEKAKRFMEEESEGGASMFHSLEKWHPRVRPGCRLAWVQCWGVPLVAWETNHLKKITAAIGDFVDVDDDVEELRRLDRARVLIKTPWMPRIDHTVNVHIGGETFSVHITEETATSTAACYCRRPGYFSSSEEIDSGYSDVQTPTKLTQPETESIPEQRLQVALGDDAEEEGDGQTAELDDIQILPSGYWNLENLKDNDVTHKERVSPPPKVRARTPTVTQGNSNVSHGTATQVRNGPFHAKGNVQEGCMVNPAASTFSLAERSNLEVLDNPRGQILNNRDQPRDLGDSHITDMGFATHTPKETHPHHKLSPDKSPTAQSNSCKFYVRKRWLKKQSGPICADAHLPQTTTGNITTSPKQNQQPMHVNQSRGVSGIAPVNPNNKKDQIITPMTPPLILGSDSPHTQATDQQQVSHNTQLQQPVQTAEHQVNKQEQEVEAIWQMAENLGITCGNVQTNYVQQLIEMEDRDNNEVQRMGGRRRLS